MSNWLEELAPALARRRHDDLYRERQTLLSAQGPSIHLDDGEYLNFSSNDYLGLANHPQVVEAFQTAASRYGVGAGASHLVIGHHREHSVLEEAIAAFLGRDRALLFSSGFAANLGVLNALLKKGDVVFEDKLNHASLIDGGLASRASFVRYRHNELSQLTRLMGKHVEKNKLIAVDGVFSMDGDIAPLDELAAICQKERAVLMADDAHGFGVLGENGGGVGDFFGLDQEQLPIVMGTLGKALGVNGAFVAGSHTLIETLIQHARTYIYTTALPPACAVAANQALSIVRQEPERRVHLRSLIGQFQEGVASLGLARPISTTAIQPIVVGANDKTLALCKELFRRKVFVAAIRPPTVPHGTSRLRVSFSAAHSHDDVNRLLDALHGSVRSVGLV